MVLLLLLCHGTVFDRDTSVRIQLDIAFYYSRGGGGGRSSRMFVALYFLTNRSFIVEVVIHILRSKALVT